MEESNKKPIMIGVIVVCIAVVGIITYSSLSGGGGVDGISEGEMTWVKCNNPNCKAEYQMGLKAYFKYMEEHANPMAPTTPPLICKECSESSAYRAEKCENPDCGIVFIEGSSGLETFADRCPKCKQSATEESRKRRKAAKEAGQ
ncbi:MAG: hypothetical protein IIB56_19015 [Planctomycetes bacterium]|nr:hypothetical protein [Planctomycetota bacterium]MCH8121345.1 hypothetical protein [Planctomycetota bacterium]